MSKTDQYSNKAETAPNLAKKLTDLRGFLKNHHTVMLVTKSPKGELHARTMAPAEITPDWKFRFIYDRESYKEKEVESDNNVNICADGGQGGDGWVSIAGKASVVTDTDLIKKLYNPTISAWFGDRGDGVHDGGPTDPRMAILEIKVDEIRHFHQVKTTLGTVVDVVASTISGKTATPGEIRTITGSEISGAWGKGELKEF